VNNDPHAVTQALWLKPHAMLRTTGRSSPGVANKTGRSRSWERAEDEDGVSGAATKQRSSSFSSS
jgi:hypothetical protein